MSHVFPEVHEVELCEYVREAVTCVDEHLKVCLADETIGDIDSVRLDASSRACELFRLVNYFHLSILPDFSNMIANLMTNRLFY